MERRQLFGSSRTCCRACPIEMLGPYISGFNTSATASSESRMASASRRFGRQCQSSVFPASIFIGAVLAVAAWRYVALVTINW